MEYIIDNKKHKVIYIEYQDGLPFSVVTKYLVDTDDKPYWCHVEWDIFKNNDDETDLRAYESGWGNVATRIAAPQYIDGYTGATYWMDEGIEFEGTPRNIKRLKRPILLKGFENSRNPFKIAEITNNCEYCDRCGCFSNEFCYEHKYDDDEGNVRYIDDDTFAE